MESVVAEVANGVPIGLASVTFTLNLPLDGGVDFKPGGVP